MNTPCTDCIRFSPHDATATNGPGPPHYRGLTITLRHTTLGRTPLDEWSARRSAHYLTTHNPHKRQVSILPARFEPAIPANERPQTHALYRAATGIGTYVIYKDIYTDYAMYTYGEVAFDSVRQSKD